MPFFLRRRGKQCQRSPALYLQLFGHPCLRIDINIFSGVIQADIRPGQADHGVRISQVSRSITDTWVIPFASSGYSLSKRMPMDSAVRMEGRLVYLQ